jgi:hypothetical protein
MRRKDDTNTWILRYALNDNANTRAQQAVPLRIQNTLDSSPTVQNDRLVRYLNAQERRYKYKDTARCAPTNTGYRDSCMCSLRIERHKKKGLQSRGAMQPL